MGNEEWGLDRAEQELKRRGDGQAAVPTEIKVKNKSTETLARATQAVGVIVDAFIARKGGVVGVAPCGSDSNIYRRSG